MVPEPTDPEPLSPKTITERFNNLEAGDELTVNNHERTYEVIETDTYSVIAEGPAGNRVTFSQNLQTGGWNVSEAVSYIETE